MTEVTEISPENSDVKFEPGPGFVP